MRGTPLTDAVSALYSLWRNEERNQTTPRLFDAVAVGYLLWPDLFGLEHGRVTVDERSMTLFEPGMEPASTVALEVDTAAFIERMMLRFLPYIAASNSPNCSRLARLWTGRKSSTCGRAATMPRVSGW